MQSFPTYRTVCEKCGRVTVVARLDTASFTLERDGYGSPIMVTLCPEHRAQYLRMFSDFLDGIGDS